jgi:hypothetical protein
VEDYLPTPNHPQLKSGLVPLVTHMNMRQMMAAIIPKVHQDKDAVEHADSGHGKHTG